MITKRFFKVAKSTEIYKAHMDWLDRKHKQRKEVLAWTYSLGFDAYRQYDTGQICSLVSNDYSKQFEGFRFKESSGGFVPNKRTRIGKKHYEDFECKFERIINKALNLLNHGTFFSGMRMYEAQLWMSQDDDLFAVLHSNKDNPFTLKDGMEEILPSEFSEIYEARK